MNNFLVISATSKSNLDLANNIKEILLDQSNVTVEVLNIDILNLPLYTESNYEKDKTKINKIIKIVTNKFINADNIIICGPEYNGSIPPIISNLIAWISVSTDYWKDGFKGKNAFIATSSGGLGKKFLKSMEIQLDHLGMIVYKNTISINSSNSFDFIKSAKILKQFIKNI